jgi:hypothetical protein
MALVKALIEVLDPEAVDDARGLPSVIEVQFNPTEYALTKAALLAEIGIPGLDSPILQFIRGQNERLNLDLLCDTTDRGGVGAGAVDVRTLTRPLYQLVKIQPRTHAPPRVRVSWGQGLSFRAVVESVTQRFTLFSPQGVPVRATTTVAFREYASLEDQLTSLNLMSRTRSWTVRAGETLSRIAGEVYGDPAHWRRIAEANPEVADPRRPGPGTELEIPPIEEAR